MGDQNICTSCRLFSHMSCVYITLDVDGFPNRENTILSNRESIFDGFPLDIPDFRINKIPLNHMHDSRHAGRHNCLPKVAQHRPFSQGIQYSIESCAASSS